MLSQRARGKNNPTCRRQSNYFKEPYVIICLLPDSMQRIRVFLLRQHLAANLICNSSERRNMTIGVMLINTGTPDAPTIEAIKPYLSEFLMDPYIMGAPYPIRKAIVSHIVSKRPEHTVENYRAFWTPAGSPFLHTSEQQAHLLQEALNSNSDNRTYRVVLAMRYGNPSISSGLEALRQEKCTDIVLLPLYPQNVKVCAGSCFKEARKQLKKLEKQGWKPPIHEIRSFHDIPAYRNALMKQISQYWTYVPGSKLIVSFHSTLLSDIKKDPTYLNQCRQTREWIANDLGLPSQDVILSFQSRFDSRAWLSPFTEQVVKDQLDQGISDICVVCPGFVADNIETTIEINRDLRNYVENVSAFCSESKGGKAALNPNRRATFTYVPALGCNPGLIEALRIAVTNATD